jgi:hypothetical protein
VIYLEQIRTLFRQLLPSGRAFKGPVGGWLDGLNNALSISESVAVTDSLSTFDSMLADNANFTADDATDWERRLGLINGTGLPLSARMQLILQQYNFPGTTLPRGWYLYIQSQLQAAGFNVYVYENRFFIGGQWVTQTPQAIAGTGGVINNEYGQRNYGQGNYGGTWGNKIANSINPLVDADFDIGNNLRSTFFIGGPTLGSYATVPLAQLQQFRQLILKLKPVQTVGFLFIVYT